LRDRFRLDDIETATYPLFANVSLPGEIRSPALHNILHHPPFQAEMRELFSEVHESVKAKKKVRKRTGLVGQDGKALK
jgi:hypothetical protein